MWNGVALLRTTLLLVASSSVQGWNVYTSSPPTGTDSTGIGLTADLDRMVRWTAGGFSTPMLRWAFAPGFCESMQHVLFEGVSVSSFFFEAWTNNYTK